jgi:hypothetical protein
MEQKKSKVTKAFYREEVKLEHGTFYSHGIMFENGDAGNYLSKNKEQNKFVEGQEAEYTFEDQGDPKYNRVKPVAQKKSFSGGGKPQRSVEEEIKLEWEKSKAFAYSHIIKNKSSLPAYAASYAKDIIAQKGGTEVKQFTEIYEDIYSSMVKSFDEMKDDLMSKLK